MPVVYKRVDEFPGYLVGDDGSVWSCLRGLCRKLKYSPRKDGYVNVGIMSKSGKVKYPLHRLVLLAFVGKPSSSEIQACHNNGIPSDNRLSNLRWDTPKGNCSDKKKHGTYYVGEMTSNVSLTEEQVLEIRQRCKSGESQKKVAKLFGVSQVAVCHIMTKRTWKHL